MTKEWEPGWLKMMYFFDAFNFVDIPKMFIKN
jgi:hypothetical protein